MTNRRFQDAGIAPLLAYVITIVGFFALSFYLFKTTEFAKYIYVLTAIMLLGRLSETRRYEFLKMSFTDTVLKKIRTTENLICTGPFLLILLYEKHFAFALFLIIATIFLALVHFKTSIQTTMWTPFSKRPFEFCVGFRNTFYLICIAYALTPIAISVNNFNLSIFTLLLVFAIALSYYSKPEPSYYVWVHAQNPRHFLFNKIKTSLLYSTLMVSPIVVANAIYFSPNGGLLLLFLMIGWAFLIVMVLTKYAAYPEEMSIPQGVLLAICLWLPPLLLIMIPYQFKQSENRLKQFLQ
jgi:hypothetical protein